MWLGLKTKKEWGILIWVFSSPTGQSVQHYASSNKNFYKEKKFVGDKTRGGDKPLQRVLGSCIMTCTQA